MINNSDISCIIEPTQGGRGGLYQGNIQTAANIQLLTSLNIRYVLTCSIEAQLEYGPGINNKILQCHDYADFDMLELFTIAHKFLDQARVASNVLVHCHAGISRSSCIVLSYLMKKRNLTLDKALGYLKSIRPIIRPNAGFLKQLLQYEQELFGQMLSVLTESLTPYYGVQQITQPIQQTIQQPIQTTQLPIQTTQMPQLIYQQPVQMYATQLPQQQLQPQLQLQQLQQLQPQLQPQQINQQLQLNQSMYSPQTNITLPMTSSVPINSPFRNVTQNQYFTPQSARNDQYKPVVSMAQQKGQAFTVPISNEIQAAVKKQNV